MNPRSSSQFNSKFTKVLLLVSATLLIIYLGLCLLLRFGQARLIFHPSAQLDATPAAQNLAYEEVRLPVSTGSLFGWWIPATNPNAPVVLYLHGNGSNIGDLINQADRLHQLRLSVLLFDYRGYGNSSPPFPNEAMFTKMEKQPGNISPKPVKLHRRKIFCLGSQSEEPWRSNWQPVIQMRQA